MSNELAISNQMSLTDLGTVLAKSGFFSDTRDAAQAVVKVLAGQELGFGPIASMTGIYVIQNRISLSANMIAAAIKRTRRYNYRVTELTDEKCRIVFTENGQEVGESTFTRQDATKAGTKNMDKFPRNMLFARALSNGAKWYCADIFGGPVYTPEELGADVNEDGDVINVPAVPVPPAQIKQPETKPEPTLPTMSLETALAVTTSEGVAYGTIDADRLGYMARSISKKLAEELSPEERETYEYKLSAIRTIQAQA